MDHASHLNPITVSTITSAAEFDRYAYEWDNVISMTPGASVHSRHFWIGHWLKTIGQDRRMSFRILRDNDGVLGCAAWVHDAMRIGGVSIPFLSLAGRPMSKRAQVVLARRQEEAAAVMLQDLSSQRWLWLDPGRLEEGDPMLSAFATSSTIASADVRSCFQLPLTSVSMQWEEYLATRSKSFRKQRKRGHIGSNLTARSYPEGFDSIESLLAAIDYVARRSWAFREHSSVVSMESEWSFWLGVIKDAALQRRFYATCIFDGETPTAFIYGLREHRMIYALKTAFVASEADRGPGRYAISSFIQSAMLDPAVDIVDFDCVTSRGDYKFSWATEVKTVRSYYAFRQGLGSGLLNKAYRLKKRWTAPNEREVPAVAGAPA